MVGHTAQVAGRHIFPEKKICHLYMSLQYRVLGTYRKYIQNRRKVRFEHVYLRLRNFGRRVDLNIS